jgi:hypothetical protein
VAAGQIAALPLLAASGAKGDPWTAGAAFGLAAAAAAWLTAQAAGRMATGRSPAARAEPRDLALHDAFTLSLIVAASAFLGDIGAALLLPAGTALLLTLRRISRRRIAVADGAMLLLLVAIAVAGLCETFGRGAWTVAAAALAAAVIVKTGYNCARRPEPRAMWLVWGVSALLCAAIAFAKQVPSGPVLISLPLVAGAIYGAAASASARILSRRHTQALSAAVPFLAVAVEAACGEPVLLTQLAAAVLIAAALAGAGRFSWRHKEAAATVPDGLRAGWPL